MVVRLCLESRPVIVPREPNYLLSVVRVDFREIAFGR
jgi:hypothetical protein